jgi:hypothetical protein
METTKIGQMKLKFIFYQTSEPDGDLPSTLQLFSHTAKHMSSVEET